MSDERRERIREVLASVYSSGRSYDVYGNQEQQDQEVERAIDKAADHILALLDRMEEEPSPELVEFPEPDEFREAGVFLRLFPNWKGE